MASSPSSRLPSFTIVDHPTKPQLDEVDASEWEELQADFHFLYSKFSSQLRTLFAFPTVTEIRACWELCRLRNGMGNATVFLPVAWSIAMVYQAQSTLSAADALRRAAFYFVMCIGIKGLIMTIDDILDSDIDGQVERTKNRAIPRGAISTERAWLFFALQLLIGVSLAYIFLSRYALSISILVWPLYVIYPTCKRWTSFAPIPLGLMFNIGVFMGWADLSTAAPSSLALIPVYLGALMWTVTYETVYQHQDKRDDMRIGVKSLALYLGDRTTRVCTCTAAAFGVLMAWGGYLNGHGAAFYYGVGAATALLLWGLSQVDMDDPEKCMEFFLMTPLVGGIVLGGLVADCVMHRLNEGILL